MHYISCCHFYCYPYTTVFVSYECYVASKSYQELIYQKYVYEATGAPFTKMD